MKVPSESQVVGVRLQPDMAGMIDQVASIRSCDRSEALRHIILIGAPLALRSQNVNIDRLLTGLEILVIDCLRRATETDAKDAEVLIQAATTNVATYHG
jgi:hypothetical protein